jgi:hypothetical protein
MRLVIGIAIGLLSLAQAWGQSCSNVTAMGTHALTCTGFVSPAAGAPQVPFSAIGIVKMDFRGNAVGAAKVSFGGVILDQAVSGISVVNSDCTGSVSYENRRSTASRRPG